MRWSAIDQCDSELVKERSHRRYAFAHISPYYARGLHCYARRPAVIQVLNTISLALKARCPRDRTDVRALAAVCTANGTRSPVDISEFLLSVSTYFKRCLHLDYHELLHS